MTMRAERQRVGEKGSETEMQKWGKCICIRETVDEFYKDRERDTHIYTGNERPTERERVEVEQNADGKERCWKRTERTSQEPVAAHSPINMYSQYPLTFGHSTRQYRHADR